MPHSVFQSAKRVAIATAIAVPVFAVLTGVMFVVPPIVCMACLFIGLAGFYVGSDFCVQSKPLAFLGGLTMFAAVFAAAIRGLLG